jgi:UDP-N-acetyl-D-mannosaminuronic acid transferase (WecB/TagA/CpsF family)
LSDWLEWAARTPLASTPSNALELAVSSTDSAWATLPTLNTQLARLYEWSLPVRDFLDHAVIGVFDGRPIRWLHARQRRGSTPRIVTGRRLFELACEAGYRAVLVGGPIADFPLPQLGGTITSSGQVIEFLDRVTRDDEPTLVFLALGSPKAEGIYSEIKAQVGTHAWSARRYVWSSVGSAADAFAGLPGVRVPPVFEHTGFAWAYRAAHQPRRLLPRYWRDAGFLGVQLLERAKHG